MMYYNIQQSKSMAPACIFCLTIMAFLILALTVVPILMSGDLNMFSGISESEISSAFESFVKEYGRNYAGAEEYERRRNAFAFNYRRITAYNRKTDRTITLGVNQFADLTDEEFEKTYLNAPSDDSECTVANIKRRMMKKPIPENDHENNDKAPIDVNWVTAGKVAPIKDQGNCGSCWTFAVTTTLETIYAIKNDISPPLKFSEQLLVDCCRTVNSNGCNGGEEGEAFDFVRENGTVLASNYPYHAADEECKLNKMKPFMKIKGYVNITAGDVDDMERVIQKQTIAVGVSAIWYAFRFYTSGVITEGCAEYPVNHGVAIVGAGTENGIGYWLVRNSWGTNWGANGYLKIARKGPKLGLCGINACAQYPLYEVA